MCNKNILKVFLLLLAVDVIQVKGKQQQLGYRSNRNSGKSSFIYLIMAISANLFPPPTSLMRFPRIVIVEILLLATKSTFSCEKPENAAASSVSENNCYRSFVSFL